MLNGELIFYNQLEENISLPKTFDLEIILTDSLGKKVSRNWDIITEYHNLIKSKESEKISVQGSVKINFSEGRLHLYNLKVGKTYNLQYVLISSNYKRLNKQIFDKNIVSNKVKFVYK